MVHVVCDADLRSVAEISAELHAVKNQPRDHRDGTAAERRLPHWRADSRPVPGDVGGDGLGARPNTGRIACACLIGRFIGPDPLWMSRPLPGRLRVRQATPVPGVTLAVDRARAGALNGGVDTGLPGPTVHGWAR